MILAAARQGMAAEPAMRTINTAHYTLKTDTSEDVAREAALRMDAMFDEYARRTADFSVPPRERLTFSLFGNPLDYYRAGPPLGSSGMFRVQDGKTDLLAMSLNRFGFDELSWHIIQHEGFHQFAYFAMGRNLPVWLNEGLAEYFGYAWFTGDGFLTGRVPESAREVVQEMIEKNEAVDFEKFMARTPEQWSLGGHSYMQAWSMTFYLVHGEDGKHQKAFAAYLSSLRQGATPEAAWRDKMPLDAAGFQTAWKKYWTAVPENSTALLAAEARVMTLASFLRRARASGQTYETMEAFLAASKKGEVALNKLQWLPPALLEQATKGSLDASEFELTWIGNLPRVVWKRRDAVITVAYGGARASVTVKAPASRPATGASGGR